MAFGLYFGMALCELGSHGAKRTNWLMLIDKNLLASNRFLKVAEMRSLILRFMIAIVMRLALAMRTKACATLSSEWTVFQHQAIKKIKLSMAYTYGST